MRFIPLASSSKGNAYLLESVGVAPLLLEAGLPIARLRDLLREHGVMLSDLAGCLVSHEHQDHAKAVKDLLKAGVDCWMSVGTAMAQGEWTIHHRLQIVSEKSFRVDQWIIQPFDLEHDAAESKGFLIAYGDDRCLFIPDTQLIENRFKSPTIIAIETNYCEEILHENIVKGYIPSVVGRRTRRNHASLNTVKEFLLANDLSKCREVWLLHLSDGNSDEKRMKDEIEQEIGIPVYIANG